MATLTLTGDLRLPGGEPLPGAVLTVRLSAAQTSGLYVLTGAATATADEAGHCELAVLIPDSGVIPLLVEVGGTIVASGQIEVQDPTQDVTLDLADALAEGVVRPIQTQPTRVVTVVTPGETQWPDLGDYEPVMAHNADFEALESRISSLESPRPKELSLPCFVFQSGWVEVAPGATSTLTCTAAIPYDVETYGGTVFALADRVQVRQYDGSEFAMAEASSVVLSISPTQAKISVTNHGEYNAQMRAVVLGTSYAWLFG